MTVFELAKKYYPDLWDMERINLLFAAGKLTADECKQITGKAYKVGKDRKA